ncbi:MAG: sulfatase-like hydrolase/transferase [Prevotella sp.]|jgi:arylsulfatase A-like enzyme|nr:sulfatase-like hydrolase/transferase [Prevotella sp.]
MKSEKNNLSKTVLTCVSVLPFLPIMGQTQNHPNVILILADDMGYAGTTFFGGHNIETPTLDLLASEGVVCTNFHTNAPVSSPTRVSILTGNYQQRVGLNHIYSATDRMDGLDPNTNPTFARQLQETGYRTGIFGKWHLGLDVSFNPTNHGFDEFRGFTMGNIDFISHRTRLGNVDWWHNKELKDEPGYTTTLIHKHAIEFIKENKNNPFFLYISHGAIHTPIQGPDDPAIRDGINNPYDNAMGMEVIEYQRRYREMIKSIDDGLQMLINELNTQGILENTMIIFLSDNGAEAIAAEKYPGANGYFRGAKNTLYEGGIRVPAIFYYPQKIKHSRTDELMMSMDLMPTILELCNVELEKKVDGVSLLPTLIDKKSIPRRSIYWANSGWIAMQEGDWKIIKQRNRTELFNMLIDPKEQHDLSEIYPERFKQMQEKMDYWWSDITKGTRLENTPNILPANGAIGR